jgi:hypothetical protein
MNESQYVFVNWMLGTFNNELETLTLSVGIMRAFESAGSAISFALGATSRVSTMTNLVVALVVYLICLPSTSLPAFEVPEHPVDGRRSAEDAEPLLENMDTNMST